MGKLKCRKGGTMGNSDEHGSWLIEELEKHIENVIELAKEHRLRSSLPVNQLNTKSASLARFYAP
jgi:hypothetical protein